MDTRPDGPSAIGAGVNFRSLSLGGVKGKVRASLTDQQISFESKTGHALDLRLDAIRRVHHHHTTLIPGWLAAVGAILVWVGFRGVTGRLQALFASVGIVLMASHFMTRKPTITIDTKANDCHTIFGADIAMIRLSSMIQNMQNGMSLEEAKMHVDNMVSDSDYPRNRAYEKLETDAKPVELFAAPVISHFIDSMSEDDDYVMMAENVSPAEKIDDLDIDLWDEEIEEPQISEGLMERARENMVTQRNHVMQHGWQGEVKRPEPYNEIYRGGFQETYGQHPRTQYPFQQTSVPAPTPPPANFLPSFVGANQAHVPHAQPERFSSPDAPLTAPELEEEKPSLVASARKEVIQKEPEPKEVSETPGQRYPGMKKLTTKSNRILKNRNRKSAGLKSGFVISELVRPNRKRKIARRRSNGTATTDALRIQAQNASNEEIANNIQNLAKSNGGDVDDAEVERMMSHLDRRAEIPSSFSELVRSDRDRGDAVNSIRRIEDES